MKPPKLITQDGLTVYDLNPLGAELYAVAGPDGFDMSKIDQNELPSGFRWVTCEEYSEIVNR